MKEYRTRSDGTIVEYNEEDLAREAELKKKNWWHALIPEPLRQLLAVGFVCIVVAGISLGWHVLRFLWNHLAITITVGVVLLLLFAFCGAYMEEKKGKKAKTNENGQQK